MNHHANGQLDDTVRRFKRYPTDMDSGVKWLGRIPSHWQAKPLGRTIRVSGGSTPSKENLAFWNGDVPWVSPKDMKRLLVDDSQDHITQDALQETRISLIPPFAILIVIRGMILTRDFPVAVNTVPVTINQDMKALRPSPSLSSLYLAHQLKAVQQAFFAIREESGHGTKCLRTELWKDVLIAIPPLDEQRKIIEFLNRDTAKIDALIAKKERLIELLWEKSMALITHTVIKGVKLNVPMRHSGMEWAGQIPATWNVRRNVLLFSERDQRGYPDLPILEVSIHTGVTERQFSDEHIEQQAADASSYKRAAKGDLVFNKMRMWQGAVGVAPVDGLVSPDYTVAKPYEGIHSKYFEFLFRTSYYMTQVNRYSHGIVMDRNRLYWDQFKEMPSLVPPWDEQVRIVQHIRNIASQTEGMITKVREAIDKLNEYRTALISAAVTGKIDVREEVA